VRKTEEEGHLLTGYLDIIFRSKLRLLVLMLLLPLAFSALDLYLWRSYEVVELVNIPEPTIFGQNSAFYLGFDPYATVAQNYTRLASNVIGTQSFNSALADELEGEGLIHPGRERAALLASLGQLTLTPGGAPSAGAGGGSSGAAAGGDHEMTIRYVCSRAAQCSTVVAAVIPVFRSVYADLKAKAADASRAVYEPQMKAAVASHDAAVVAVQQYEAKEPKSTTRSSQPLVDPVLNSLNAEVDRTQKVIDQLNTQLQSIQTQTQVANAVASDLQIVDGPRVLNGLYGIKGLRSDNVKTDTLVWAGCLAAAAAYLLLVAYLDRTVRDPAQIKNRLGKRVITIPAYASKSKRTKLRARLLTKLKGAT
jgi:hypothetical protein